MPEILEIGMLICFGFSWPINVMKSYRTRSTKGKSVYFLFFIILGYLCGIGSKLIGGSYKWYVLFFYVLNMTMVTVDLCLYFRNAAIEMKEAKGDVQK